MKLSKNFSLKELIKTSKPDPNVPGSLEKQKLFYLCQFILQPIRDKFGAITVTSGYRSLIVNSSVGGSVTSQHVKGEACDIVSGVDMSTVFEWVVDSLHFGQAIHEKKNGNEWIHISLPRIDKPNRQALLYDGKKYTIYNAEGK